MGTTDMRLLAQMRSTVACALIVQCIGCCALQQQGVLRVLEGGVQYLMEACLHSGDPSGSYDQGLVIRILQWRQWQHTQPNHQKHLALPWVLHGTVVHDRRIHGVPKMLDK